ncbi:MAG TPA: S-layer homology domain-containing protein [Candidatus Aminicenantes bacterium]|nr:S-layer homology domain-containing protein [Candidatus Aminicenantes bacterium]
MVRRFAAAGLALVAAWSCATVPPPAPPAFYVEGVPNDQASRLRLDDRIAAEDAWKALRTGRPELARKYLLKLGTANPVREAGLAYADLLLGNLPEAEARFKSSVAGTPAMLPSRVGLAQIYESRRDRDKTFNEYREILKLAPDHRWARPRFEALRDDLVREAASAARAALAAGNRETAKRELLKVLFYAPETASAHLELARLYRLDKDRERALLHFRTAVESGTADKALLREYAEFLADAGELGQSLEVLEKLAEAEPRDTAASKRVEELRAKLGVYEIPSQYDAIPSLDIVTREDLAALIGVKFEAYLDVPARRTEILVDISVSWAQRYIVKVASLEIMTSYDNHTFQPRRVINRADLADAAVRLIGVLQGRGARFVPLVDTRRIQIADVSPDNLYFRAITSALGYQIMALTPERLFEPERAVSGEEAIRTMDLILRLAG